MSSAPSPRTAKNAASCVLTLPSKISSFSISASDLPRVVSGVIPSTSSGTSVFARSVRRSGMAILDFGFAILDWGFETEVYQRTRSRLMAQSKIASTAGIVLAGGKSTRMGLAKATLPFGPELMLQRVVRILGGIVRPIVVVAAPRQELPALTPDVRIGRDEREGRGPLEGLLVCLTAVAGQAEAAYATSCDVPLLVPAFVEALIARLGDAEIAVPMEGQFPHP